VNKLCQRHSRFHTHQEYG